MLKARLIPCIITKGDLVVQSFNFNRYQPIGNVKTAIEFFVNWDVDEIVILDIDATIERRSPNIELVKWAAQECFVPLTVGGGIQSLRDIKNLLNAGADKICLNSVALERPEFVKEAVRIYGSQCITVSVDAIWNVENSNYSVYSYKNDCLIKQPLEEMVCEMEALGAGEIFLNSVDRDGSRLGYDVKLLQEVSSRVGIPVIACGGVGKFSDLSVGIKSGGCQAVAAANIFQHCEHSTIAAKAHMLKEKVPVRLSSNVKYDNFEFDNMGRPY